MRLASQCGRSQDAQCSRLYLIWSPVSRMTIGAEYIRGRRVDESGDDGTLNRLQLSAKYVY